MSEIVIEDLDITVLMTCDVCDKEILNETMRPGENTGVPFHAHRECSHCGTEVSDDAGDEKCTECGKTEPEEEN